MTGAFLRRNISTFAVMMALAVNPLEAQTVSLSPGQVRALAVATLEAGNPQGAAVATDALLQRFPDDASALLIRAEAAILLNDFAGATGFARRAFWNAVNDTQRFSAARLTALGHARQTQDNRAMIWLRVARQYAPTEETSALVAREFQAVRARNPLTVNLRFGVTPSTNINGGTFNETIDIDFGGFILPGATLSQDAIAQSGWEISGSGSVRYMLRSDATSATFLDAGVSGSTYVLTESSEQAFADLQDTQQASLRRDLENDAAAQQRELDQIETLLANPELSDNNRALLEERQADIEAELLTPEEIDQQVNDVDALTGSDFSFAQVNVGVSHVFALAPDIGITEAGLYYNRTLRRDRDEKHRVTASLSHRYALSDVSSISFSGVSAREKYVVGGDESQSFRLQTNYRHFFENVGSFNLGYEVERSRADRPSDEFDATTISLGFSPSDPLFGANVGLSLAYQEVDWDQFDSFTGPRSDEVLTARMTATLREVEFFGFNPVISIERSERDSDGERFQRETTTISFDIVSSF